MPIEPNVSILTEVLVAVLAVNGEMLMDAGAAFNTGTEETTEFAVMIETLEISPRETNDTLDIACAMTVFTLVNPNGDTLPGKCQSVPEMATFTFTSEMTFEKIVKLFATFAPVVSTVAIAKSKSVGSYPTAAILAAAWKPAPPSVIAVLLIVPLNTLLMIADAGESAPELLIVTGSPTV